LQGLSRLTQLTHLALRKFSLACLGEAQLGARQLALLQPLRQLSGLHLSACRLDDASFGLLCAALPRLSGLTLLGQAQLTLQVRAGGGGAAVASACCGCARAAS
jgi:hypothetical protein